MKKSGWLFYIILPGLLLVSAILNLSLGSVSIPPLEVLQILKGQESAIAGGQAIIWELRIPKLLTATIAGAGLAISGLLMQTLFRNPLAGPFVLGISTGASLGVALLILAAELFGVIWIGTWGSWATVLSAVLGSGLVLMIILGASFFVADSMTLLIIGLMMGSLSGAIVSILQYFSQAEQIQSYLLWTFGNLGGVFGTKLWLMATVVSIGLIISIMLIKALNSLLIGETYAQSMGVSISKVRLLIIISTALLAGGITAFCGPLAFIGIAVPHLCRVLFKTSNHQILIPASVFTGAIILILCDTLAQLPGYAQTLPINAITSLIGAPAVIAILLKNRQVGNSFAQ